MRELVRRYGGWQLRDYFVERGLWTALGGLAALALLWLNYDANPPAWLTDTTAIPPQSQAAKEQQLAAWIAGEPKRFRDGVFSLFTIIGFAGTLLATHGIVARDRERGYHRFLFAKPVSLVAYYAQAFAISGVGLLAVCTALLGATAVAFQRAVPVEALGVVASEFALLGGTVFLLSALWRFDFVLGALSWPVAAFVGAFARERHRLWIAQALEPLLPPVRRFSSLAHDINAPSAVEGMDAFAVFAYGAAAFVAGLLVLRRRASAE